MKPILFNTEMVRAILYGCKTVTQRKPFQMEEGYSLRAGIYLDAAKRPCTLFEKKENGMMFVQYVRAPYAPGDILYVRETWAKLWYVDQDGYTHYDQPMYYYAADGNPDITLCDGDGFEQDDQRIRWHPSIHMPKEAARLFGRVTGLRVQRVQDITDEEARREGAADREDFRRVWNRCYAKPRPVKGENGEIDHYESYPWEDIHETRAYRGKLWYVIGNPWVWVIEFERVTKEVAEEA